LVPKKDGNCKKSGAKYLMLLYLEEKGATRNSRKPKIFKES